MREVDTRHTYARELPQGDTLNYHKIYSIICLVFHIYIYMRKPLMDKLLKETGDLGDRMMLGLSYTAG